jgi:anti-anti-sigma factor
LNCSEQTIERSDAGTLRLAGALDAYAAVELCDALSEALRDQAELAVDLSAVESCDFTTIQLLFSALRSAEQAGKPFAVTALSEAVLEACAALGVSCKAFSAAPKE